MVLLVMLQLYPRCQHKQSLHQARVTRTCLHSVRAPHRRFQWAANIAGPGSQMCGFLGRVPILYRRFLAERSFSEVLFFWNSFLGKAAMCMAWQTPCRRPILREAITCNRCTQVFVLKTMVSKTPVCARKPWQCRDLKLRNCMIVLGRRNLTAKFDGGISGKVFRRKTRRSRQQSTRRKMRRSFREILLDQKCLLESITEIPRQIPPQPKTGSPKRVARECFRKAPSWALGTGDLD